MNTLNVLNRGDGPTHQRAINAICDADIQTINGPELVALIGVDLPAAEIMLDDLADYRIVSPPGANGRRAVFVNPADRAVILPA
jgi:hypothetical protein